MTDFIFEGFEPANTTPVPDILFDRLLPNLSGAELKVLLYIIRRTWGFKKATDAISLSQFTEGITTREGKVLDLGCGIKNRTIVSKALADLETMGCIKSKKGDDPLGDRATTLYSIRFKGSAKSVPLPSMGSIESVPPSNKSVLPVVSQPYYGSNQSVLGVVSKSYPQETVLQQTDKQDTEERTIESSGKSAERTTGASALSLDARSQSENDYHSYSPSDSTTPEPAPSEAEQDSTRLQESPEGEPLHEPGTHHFPVSYPAGTSGDSPDGTQSQEGQRSQPPMESDGGQEQARAGRDVEEVAHGLVGMAAPGHPVRVGDTAGAAMGSGCDTGQDRQVATPGARPVLEASEKIDALSRAWQEIGDSAHEDILQVLRPSGLPDGGGTHGAVRCHPLPGLGAAGTADVSLVAGAQRWDAGGRGEEGVGAVGATGEGRATDGRLGKGDNDNDTTDTTTHLPADRDTLPHPGDTGGDTGGQPTQEAIEQTASFPPTVEPGQSWGTLPGAPVPSVVPSNDRGTTPNSPVSPLTTSTVVQAGALPASSVPLSPTNGQGTTFSAGMDDEAKGQAGKQTGKRKTTAKAEEPTKSDTKEIQKRIDTHRGYPLEEKVDLIRERQAVKTWCGLHTLEQYEMVMDELKRDSYWGKSENYYRIGGLTLLRETSRILARVERRQASNLRIVPPPEPVVDKSKLFNMEHIVLPRKGASR